MAGMEALRMPHGMGSLTEARLAVATAEFLSCQQQRHILVPQYKNIPQESQSLGKLVIS